MDLLINLIANNITQLLIKLFLVPAIAVLLVFIIQAIWLKFKKGDTPFPVKSKLVLLNSIILVAIIINLYWFLIIKFNGIYVFSWSLFPYRLNNIYLMLSPLFVSYIALVILYYKTQSKIKKLI